MGKARDEVFDEVEQRTLTIRIEVLHRFFVAELRCLVLRHHIGQVAIDAPRPVIGRMQARTRHRFIAVHQVFAFAEGVEKHCHCADVERMCAQPQQMVEHARNLVEQHADVLRTQRHFNAKQLLNRHHIGVLVDHHRHVVEAVHVGHRLDEGLGLGQLLGRAMQQADMRVGALHNFTV